MSVVGWIGQVPGGKGSRTFNVTVGRSSAVLVDKYKGAQEYHER